MLTNLFLHAVRTQAILFNMISLYIGGMMLERLLWSTKFLTRCIL